MSATAPTRAPELVQDVMTRLPATVSPDAPLDRAMDLLDARDVRHLPVVDGERLVGILSDRDLMAATGWMRSAERTRGGELVGPRRVSELVRGPALTVEPGATCRSTAELLVEWRVGAVPVVAAERLVGIVSDTDLLDAFAAACACAAPGHALHAQVADAMTREVHRLPPDASVELAAERCRVHGVRHLCVCEGDTLVGIVSDRDLRLALGRARVAGLEPSGAHLADAMTRAVVAVEPTLALDRAAALLVRNRCGALPVVERGALIGIATTSDVLRHYARAS